MCVCIYIYIYIYMDTFIYTFHPDAYMDTLHA